MWFGHEKEIAKVRVCINFCINLYRKHKEHLLIKCKFFSFYIYREAFERNCRAVELTPDHVPDINVITGVLKDYLRELPEPLFTRCLFQMTVDALGTCRRSYQIGMFQIPCHKMIVY